MVSQKITERAESYIAVIDEIVARYPESSSRLDMGPSVAHVFAYAPIRITPAYAHWLALSKNDDVTKIQCDEGTHVYKTGVEAVEYLLLHSMFIVKQLLSNGVDPHVAVGLLPHELACAVHREYWNRTT